MCGQGQNWKAGKVFNLARPEGRFMGEPFGEVSGAKLPGLLRGASSTAQSIPCHHYFDNRAA